MNILRVIDSASTLFHKKIKVTLINAQNGSVIKKAIIDSKDLPETFNKPTILEIENNHWRIVKAQALNAGSYFQAARLTLHAILQDEFDAGGKYPVPTLDIINEQNTIETDTKFRDFTLSIAEHNWLQLEFHTYENIVEIQNTMEKIEEVINSSDENNHLLGYDSAYIREINFGHQLKIPFSDFCTFLNANEKGNISFHENTFIKNGFSIKTSNYTYYGIIDEGIIRKLAIEKFDFIDDELSNLLARYNLLFVDWCNTYILS